jgi:hypothetical protein
VFEIFKLATNQAGAPFPFIGNTDGNQGADGNNTKKYEIG